MKPEREVDIDDIEPDEAVLDALLAEQLGAERAPDLTARVLAAHGDRSAAAARARAAASTASGRRERSPWLAAAGLLLGCAVVVAITWLRTVPTPAPAPGPAPGPAPAPVQPQEPSIIEVDSIAELRRLLPSVTTLRVESWFLASDSTLDLRGAPPWTADAATLRDVVDALMKDEKMEVTRPAGWKWQNRLLFADKDGRAIAMAVNRYTRGTVGMRGLTGDLFVARTAPLAHALAAAEQAACEHLGILRRRAELAPDSPFRASSSVIVAGYPVPTEELNGNDLVVIASFAALRRLDLGHVAARIDRKLLEAISRNSQIEELILDGTRVDDEELRVLANMNLRALSVRRGAGLRGRAFGGALFAEVPQWFTSLERLDLSDCKALHDDLLADLGRLPRLRELALRGVPLPASAAAFQALVAGGRLEVLDLAEHDLKPDALRAIAGATALRELKLSLCEIDDADLAILAAAKGPLATLIVTGNTAITIAGLRRIAELPTLREVRVSTATPVSDAELAELAKSKPRLHVVRD
jgi:hypothetical protein